MNEDTLARAFEPFFTTKEVGKGSGLGLSMVHGFVEQSRGRLKIQSALGKGTCVKLYLPRALKEAEHFEAPLTSRVLRGGFEKVLVVEDNDLVRAQVTSELKTLGYRVVSVEQGAQALEAIRQTPDFDLLFTDSVLPGGMDGRQLAEEARKLRPTLPVLFTSGHTENGAEGHGRLDPGVALLKKPFRRHDLAAKVRQVLASNEKTSS
jgi:CheY-like chemotaxis protein